jgi:beta-glucanase (GH16 family)
MKRAQRKKSLWAFVALACAGVLQLHCSAEQPAIDESPNSPDGSAPRDAGRDATPKPDARAPDANPPEPPDKWIKPERDGWTLVWRDEFDGQAGAAVDSSKWSFETGGDGWGNNELQYYTDRTDNARLDGNGHLVIRALRELYKGRDFTSARMKTEGKFDQTYGRFEIRAKMPLGRGVWPAFWLIGSNHVNVGWPESGEIDILEYLGHQPGTVRGSLHGPGYSMGDAITTLYRIPGQGTFADRFYVFAIEWAESDIRFYVNDERYVTRGPSSLPMGKSWVFDGHPFFIVMNMAVGGTLAGTPDASANFPLEYVVDHVRVYRR